jgi:hypothetical protein
MFMDGHQLPSGPSNDVKLLLTIFNGLNSTNAVGKAWMC